ncbi:SgcJ/EcaC family oxidoreductase [Streptomyces sp. CB04723]|uniref:SgcJ/EcaC family oxidoreductase n=1 Tax=Streptomyces TaxID=1883 RepID=UPI0015C41B4B|nr:MULTISPECIES: SgcJ/EcaC family oxidoreductase [Streptomyces]MBK0376072.1 SgcJ/EcaC family oxidoreductase [Streptomyces sp. RB110-1]MBK0387554.1 SgcJ/EcaC family oxidoreductase [Streptomyces sp. RB110-2]MCF3168248.1 SgcJ/EcaC family oxidoreductase [Streptomyces violaceoruber]QLG32925.1 SgcJ/EcaC family oxidoreductase [Streptomyces sp. CB04723]
MSATPPVNPATAPGPAPTVLGVPAPQEDVDAIVAFVARVEHAQQNALPDAFLDGFREDALWTTAHGKRLTGLPEISAFTRTVLPPQAGSPVTATYTVDLILFIRPDIAAVKIRQRPVSRPDGRFLDEVFHGSEDPSALMAAHPEAIPGTPTYVLAKDGGVWRIAAAQNTQVLDAGTLAAG